MTASRRTAADITGITWSTRSDVYTTNAIPAVQYLFATYPTNGTYTSAIFDTVNAAPIFTNVLFNSVVPSGGS